MSESRTNEYYDVMRAAACGTVYVSRKTDLSGERKTVSSHMARRLRSDGMVQFANVSPDWLILTGGRHALENAYDDRFRSTRVNDGSPENRADQLVSMLKSLRLSSAVFIPENQVVGLSLEDWSKLMKTSFRKPDGFPLLSTFTRLAKKLLPS